MQTYEYIDQEGKPTDSIQYIVTKDVELLAYQYIEKNGKAPSKELINSWVEKMFNGYGLV